MDNLSALHSANKPFEASYFVAEQNKMDNATVKHSPLISKQSTAARFIANNDRNTYLSLRVRSRLICGAAEVKKMENGESRNMAQEHNTQQIVMLIIAS